MRPELFNFIKTIPISRRFTLGPKERLKSRKLIEELFSRGRKMNVFPFRVFYLQTKSEQPLQAGFGVSGKNFKKAVDRNRIKRLTRESYRLQKQNLKDRLAANNQSLALFFIYTARELPEYPEVYQKVKIILENLIRGVDEKNPSNP